MSDRNKKESIKLKSYTEDYLSKITNLNIYSFKYKKNLSFH